MLPPKLDMKEIVQLGASAATVVGAPEVLEFQTMPERRCQLCKLPNHSQSLESPTSYSELAKTRDQVREVPQKVFLPGFARPTCLRPDVCYSSTTVSEPGIPTISGDETVNSVHTRAD